MVTRKTKVRVKTVLPVEWLLTHATGQQLAFLDGIAKHPDFAAFIRLVGLFKEYNVYEVFNSLVRDDNELSLLRAAKRGEVAGLDALIHTCQLAADEIKRRKQNP